MTEKIFTHESIKYLFRIWFTTKILFDYDLKLSHDGLGKGAPLYGRGPLVLLWPALACPALTGIHAYLGVHVIERGVIFVDLSLTHIVSLGATVTWAIEAILSYVATHLL